MTKASGARNPLPQKHIPPPPQIAISSVEERVGTWSLFDLLSTKAEIDAPDIPPECPILCLENLHLVSIRPSGQKDKEKLHPAWNRTRGLEKGVTGGASPDESP